MTKKRTPPPKNSPKKNPITIQQLVQEEKNKGVASFSVRISKLSEANFNSLFNYLFTLKDEKEPYINIFQKACNDEFIARIKKQPIDPSKVLGKLKFYIENGYINFAKDLLKSEGENGLNGQNLVNYALNKVNVNKWSVAREIINFAIDKKLNDPRFSLNMDSIDIVKDKLYNADKKDLTEVKEIYNLILDNKSIAYNATLQEIIDNFDKYTAKDNAKIDKMNAGIKLSKVTSIKDLDTTDKGKDAFVKIIQKIITINNIEDDCYLDIGAIANIAIILFRAMGNKSYNHKLEDFKKAAIGNDTEKTGLCYRNDKYCDDSGNEFDEDKQQFLKDFFNIVEKHIGSKANDEQKDTIKFFKDHKDLAKIFSSEFKGKENKLTDDEFYKLAAKAILLPNQDDKIDQLAIDIGKFHIFVKKDLAKLIEVEKSQFKNTIFVAVAAIAFLGAIGFLAVNQKYEIFSNVVKGMLNISPHGAKIFVRAISFNTAALSAGIGIYKGVKLYNDFQSKILRQDTVETTLSKAISLKIKDGDNEQEFKFSTDAAKLLYNTHEKLVKQQSQVK